MEERKETHLTFNSIYNQLDKHKWLQGKTGAVVLDLKEKIYSLMHSGGHIDTHMTTLHLENAKKLLVHLNNAYYQLNDNDENGKKIKDEILAITKEAFSSYLPYLASTDTMRTISEKIMLTMSINREEEKQKSKLSPEKEKEEKPAADNSTLHLFQTVREMLLAIPEKYAKDNKFGIIILNRAGERKLDISEATSKNKNKLNGLVMYVNSLITLISPSEKSYRQEEDLLEKLVKAHDTAHGKSKTASHFKMEKVSDFRNEIFNITKEAFKEYLPKNHNIKTMHELKNVIKDEMEKRILIDSFQP